MLFLFLLAATADQNPPRVEHDPQLTRTAGAPVLLWFQVKDESALFGVSLFVRSSAQEAWKQVPVVEQQDGWFEGAVSSPPGFAYFFEAYDLHGNGPTRVGTPEMPFVDRSELGPLTTERPWDPMVVVKPPSAKPAKPAIDLRRVAWVGGTAVGVVAASWLTYRLLRDQGGSAQVALVPVPL
jgi:hypothetical protein